ncbi:pantetheine-phosphate adenylyltransferase [Planctomicrobium sp. SH527]|uniref:pantetheine-phosphate adenylyltransferase n=1 Tax=Planctomicrobium sp. SH527 TaxID=3448123 RepID=UPI003F5C7AEE
MSTRNPRVAVYAGSFDPLTWGHDDIARRGAMLFDELIVGIGVNPDKKPLFNAEERVEMAREIFADVPNIRVESFTGLTVDFAHSVNASVMIRGVRTVSDIESEFTMALANRMMAAELETVFLMASEQFSHISSTLIKQIAMMGRDTTLQQLLKFVPKQVVTPLLEKVTRVPSK